MKGNAQCGFVKGDKMRFISHRGNLTGPEPENENKPEYIQQAINKGYEVEIDVWCNEGNLYLGHDKPVYPISTNFLFNNRLWCHAKSIETLNVLIAFDDIHSFFHDTDAVTLTSQGFLWTFPGKEVFHKSIAVLPNEDFKTKNCAGICSDNIELFYEFIN